MHPTTLLLTLVAAAAPAFAQEAAPPNPGDVAFLQGMIGHHAQALVMSALIPARTEDPQLRLLGERITVSQKDEIEAMRTWLKDRRQAAPDPLGTDAAAAHGAHAGHAMPGAAPAAATHDHASMPGMLSPAQLDTLAAARGADFDRLFLRYMIQHHEGAIVMVRQLFATRGAGQDAQLFTVANDIEADQAAEIRRMRAMLSTRNPRP